MSRIYNKDANHDEIKQAYIEAHLDVIDTAGVGGGFPDLVVGGYHQKLEIPYTALVEIKTADGKLRPNQKHLQDNWRGCIFTVRTRAEALAVFGIEIAAAREG